MLEHVRRIAAPIAERIGMEPGNFVGVCLGVFSGLMLMANGAVGKSLGAEIHPFVVTFFRSIIMAAVLFPIFARNGYARIAPSNHKATFANGAIFSGAFILWFWALPRVPLDMVAAIGFTSQLYAICGAILFLGERPRPWRWWALAVGFVGAVIILRPGFAPFTPGVVALIFSALLFSTNRLIIKVLATKDNPESVVIWMAIWASVFSLPLAVYHWSTPNLGQFMWFAILAGLTIMSHFSMAWALRVADVAAVEPTSFTRLIWGAVLGFAFFGDVPHLFTFIGGAIVLGSILYIARRERREGIAARAAIAEVTATSE